MRMLQFPGTRTIVALWHLFRFIGSNQEKFLGALNKSAKTEDPWISILSAPGGESTRDFMLMLFNCSKIAGCLFITDMRV